MPGARLSPKSLPCEHRLWWRRPAPQWHDGIVLGNGRLGAIWQGAVSADTIFLNHENLWRAVDKHQQIPVRHQHLPEIREAFFRRDWVRARDLCTKYLSGPPFVPGNLDRIQPYQVFGQLDLTFRGLAEEPYRRELRLDDAVGRVQCAAGGGRHERQLFVSAAHDVVVLRVKGPPGALSGRVALTRETDPDCELGRWARGNRIGFTGRFREGIEFAAEARLHTDGTLATDGADLELSGGTELLLVLTMAVDYSEPGPAACCEKRLDRCPARFAPLLAAHKAEYAPRYARCALALSSPAAARRLPTDARLERLRAGNADPGLIALAFNFGRYLLLSCSRNCEQPANLQGIWNPQLRPPWESDFHIDINVQMNYSGAESCNLPECAEPLFDFMERHEPGARQSARNYYNCRGIHMVTGDIWQMYWYPAADWDILPSSAAWLAQHLWFRYEFSDDLEFLRRRAYPFIKGVAEFYEDFLIPHPETGQLVTVPSQSPENTFVGGPGPVSYCVAPTTDLVLIREVLEHCLLASRALDVDAHLRPGWEEILKRLPPFQIGRHGQLQEWLEDFEESDPGHRHLSHLIGVYPGDLMGPARFARYFKAARVSLERRIAAGGGGNTEWSMPWKCGLFARWQEGDLAAEQLRILLKDFCTAGLLTTIGVFQIDGNLGLLGGVAEMLLQSHGGVLRLLPALPSGWPAGRVHGLCARHRIEVDLEWRDGRLIAAQLHPQRSGTVCIAYGNRTRRVRLQAGKARVVRAREFGPR